jgi:hypothetical protein
MMRWRSRPIASATRKDCASVGDPAMGGDDASRRGGTKRFWRGGRVATRPRRQIGKRAQAPNMKRIGLLGGMSWESSIECYCFVNEEVRERLGGLHSAIASSARSTSRPWARRDQAGLDRGAGAGGARVPTPSQWNPGVRSTPSAIRMPTSAARLRPRSYSRPDATDAHGSSTGRNRVGTGDEDSRTRRRGAWPYGVRRARSARGDHHRPGNGASSVPGLMRRGARGKEVHE